jgi:adenosylcobinamide kinase/adenosylcobinamide-phosphate guanylyltransferase
MAVTLVLGGARSGKSAFAQRAAETWASAQGATPLYIATAEPGDAEMAERIERHRLDRGGAWRTLEAPLDLAGALAGLAEADVAVIDCLTLWLANAMAQPEGHEARAEQLLGALTKCPARLWLVSNEVGWGIVPDNALARAFRDAAGRLHQAIAEAADAVVLVVAGLPLTLKPGSEGPR